MFLSQISGFLEPLMDMVLVLGLQSDNLCNPNNNNNNNNSKNHTIYTII